MPILNYTTSVESDKSIAEITGLLTRFGARSITTEFDNDGFVSGISFIIMIGVYSTLRTAKGVPNRNRTQAQARRVAWRILKDWLEAQLALFQVGQAEAAQVLMPYAIDAEGRTAYQMFRESHLKQLPAGNVVEGKFLAAGGEQ